MRQRHHILAIHVCENVARLKHYEQTFDIHYAYHQSGQCSATAHIHKSTRPFTRQSHTPATRVIAAYCRRE
jgi:hypothetical protein